MYEQRIPPPPDDGGVGCIVTLLRTWCTALERGCNPLAALSTRLGPALENPELVPACDSLFALTQACLGRPLLPAPPGSLTLSHDEEALLEMLRHVPALMAAGPNAAIPHGLPGALQWAAFAVLRAWNSPPELAVELHRPLPTAPATCPFARPA